MEEGISKLEFCNACCLDLADNVFFCFLGFIFTSSLRAFDFSLNFGLFEWS